MAAQSQPDSLLDGSCIFAANIEQSVTSAKAPHVLVMLFPSNTSGMLTR